MPTIDIIIVNWNTGAQLKDCLRSIAVATRKGFVLNGVTVVDNASVDGSADGLDEIGLPLRIVCNKINRGFAAACNQGARGSTADHLLFLNPDMRLSAEALSVPFAFMEKRENAGVGVCGIRMVDEGGVAERSCARRPTVWMFVSHALGLDRLAPKTFPSHHMREWPHDETMDVDHVIGAFYFVRRSIFDKLCGFDERFFVYLEDLDFSCRAKKEGWRIYYLAEAAAFHKGGGASARVKARRLCYSNESRVRFAFKHFSFVSGVIVGAATFFVEPWIRAFAATVRLSPRLLWDTFVAYGILWRRCFMPARALREQESRICGK